jgi:uncharacterized protein (TIGR02246 family)
MSSDAQVADELAIRALVARYADAVNVADADHWGRTWAEDAVWDLGGKVVSGRDEIVSFWRTAMASFEAVIQMVSHGTVQVDGDGATGRWTIWEVGRRAGDGTLVVGCYRDSYVRISGEWLFSGRTFRATYRGQVPAGEFLGFPSL